MTYARTQTHLIQNKRKKKEKKEKEKFKRTDHCHCCFVINCFICMMPMVHIPFFVQSSPNLNWMRRKWFPFYFVYIFLYSLLSIKILPLQNTRFIDILDTTNGIDKNMKNIFLKIVFFLSFAEHDDDFQYFWWFCTSCWQVEAKRSKIYWHLVSSIP